MKSALLLLALAGAACHTVAPVAPRFVVLFEQQHRHCRITVLRDTRSAACFVWAKCGRDPSLLVLTPTDVCIP